MTDMNESIQEHKELLDRFHRTEWTSMNEDERQKLKQHVTLSEKKQELYLLRTSKTILSILHKVFQNETGW